MLFMFSIRLRDPERPAIATMCAGQLNVPRCDIPVSDGKGQDDVQSPVIGYRPEYRRQQPAREAGEERGGIEVRSGAVPECRSTGASPETSATQLEPCLSRGREAAVQDRQEDEQAYQTKFGCHLQESVVCFAPGLLATVGVVIDELTGADAKQRILLESLGRLTQQLLARLARASRILFGVEDTGHAPGER